MIKAVYHYPDLDVFVVNYGDYEYKQYVGFKRLPKSVKRFVRKGRLFRILDGDLTLVCYERKVV